MDEDVRQALLRLIETVQQLTRVVEKQIDDVAELEKQVDILKTPSPVHPLTLGASYDPCESCKPHPDATSWACYNAACPKRTRVTC